MDKLPLETFAPIIACIEESEYRKYERFPTLTAASKQGIISARTVWSAYRNQDPLRRLFVKVLEEHPFAVSGLDDRRGNISGLEALSRSEYAQDLTTLSFCPMVLRRGLQVYDWPPGALNALVEAVQRLPSLEHVRYYTVPASQAQGRWRYPGNWLWRPRQGQGWGFLNDVSNKSIRPDIQAAEGFGRLQRCFPHGTLQTLTMPYCSNIGAFCALPRTAMSIDQPMFPATLRRVSINLILHLTSDSIFDTWIYQCPNLEYLEIALCRAPEFNLDKVGVQACWGGPRSDEEPTKLSEIRLLTDTSYYIDGRMLMMALREFPSLKKLAMGHVLMRNNTWDTFFDILRDKADHDLDLDVLWLLNPTHNADTWPEPPYVRYEDDDDAASGAAQEVKIVHLPFPWDEKDVIAGIGRGHEFPGFEAFEEEGRRTEGEH